MLAAKVLYFAGESALSLLSLLLIMGAGVAIARWADNKLTKVDLATNYPVEPATPPQRYALAESAPPMHAAIEAPEQVSLPPLLPLEPRAIGQTVVKRIENAFLVIWEELWQ